MRSKKKIVKGINECTNRQGMEERDELKYSGGELFNVMGRRGDEKGEGKSERESLQRGW